MYDCSGRHWKRPLQPKPPVFITFLRISYNSLIINVSILQCGCPESQYIKENHGQALAPNGALSLSLRDSLASKLADYPVG